MKGKRSQNPYIKSKTNVGNNVFTTTPTQKKWWEKPERDKPPMPPDEPYRGPDGPPIIEGELGEE